MTMAYPYRDILNDFMKKIKQKGLMMSEGFDRQFLHYICIQRNLEMVGEILFPGDDLISL